MTAARGLSHVVAGLVAAGLLAGCSSGPQEDAEAINLISRECAADALAGDGHLPFQCAQARIDWTFHKQGVASWQRTYYFSADAILGDAAEEEGLTRHEVFTVIKDGYHAETAELPDLYADGTLDTYAPGAYQMSWTVPGRIVDTNGTVSGNTVTWDASKESRFYARFEGMDQKFLDELPVFG